MLDHVSEPARSGEAGAIEVVLREVFGFSGLRPGQAEAVAAALAGRDTAVLLPTGAGKSLCFQLPAIVASRMGRGTTIVISPLIALMQDQIAGLVGRGVAAAALHSHQEDDDQRAIVTEFLAGRLALLYVSPERAALASFHRMLRRVPIALLAIDEAHCVSQWGHDFRPEYLELHKLRELVDAPVIAVTATATPRVMAELVSALHLASPAIVRGDFARPNLQFAVRHLDGEARRLAALIAACDDAGLRPRTGPGRAIVYCTTRKKAEKVADALAAAGFAAGYYHAGRTALARDRAQRGFALGRTRILVATNAFGMGIDHGDVRLIVHFQTPGSLEAYYQEAGRAGRDGAPARCLMLFGAGDLVTQRKLASGKRVEDALAAIAHYANSERCRQQLLCAYFTGTDAHPACGTCDVCSGAVVERVVHAPPAPIDDAARAVILAAAGRLARPVGKTTLAKALRGSHAKPVELAGLLQLPEHGQLAALDEDQITAGIDALVADRRLERRGRKFPTVWLRGRPVHGDRPARTTPRPARARASDLYKELDRYRKRMARTLKWKAYMVLQRSVLTAIDAARPQSREALARIRGLGPAKIDRFGDDLIAAVRRHS